MLNLETEMAALIFSLLGGLGTGFSLLWVRVVKPLMDLLKNQDYFKDSVETIKKELQTNGGFSSNAATWIAQNIDMVWVSLDGPPDIHDAQRFFTNKTPSSSVVLRNIKTLQKGNCKVGIRPTITSRSLYRMREIVDYAQALYVDAVYFHHVIAPQGKNSKTADTLYQIPLMEFARKYLDDVVPHIIKPPSVVSLTCAA